MAKKIRFPLEMDNGVEVRSMEELREKFSLARVIAYLRNGKLVIWLRDRYENDIADLLEQLDNSEEELAKKVCEIFDIPYNEETKDDLRRETDRVERINYLKKYTDDKRFIDEIDKVAFNQDELYDLLDEKKQLIYLCGNRFAIPLSQSGISYIGINNPVVVINSKTIVDWSKKRIVFEGVTFDEKYRAVTEKFSRDNNGIIENSVICHTIDVYSGTNNREGVLTENENGIFYFKDHVIYRKKNGMISSILKSSNFNYQKLIGCGNQIVFTHMVGNNRGDHLCVYFSDIDIYEEIERFVYEFTISGRYIYYVKSNDCYADSNRKLVRCDIDGENKRLIKDFGRISENIYDLKIAKNRVYYKRKLAGIMGCGAEEHAEYVEINGGD